MLLVLVDVAGCHRPSPPRLALKEARVPAPLIQLIDIADDASDPSNNDDSEPSIAVDPKNPAEIAVVAFSGAWGDGTRAPIWKSRDSGATWKPVPQIPQPSANLWGPADQKVAFDADGRLYVTELGESKTQTNVAEDFIFRQIGGPDDPLVPSKQFGDDQPHLSADIYASVCRDSLYSAWLKTQYRNTLDRSMDSATRNGGKSLLDVSVGDNAHFANRTSRVAVGRDGRAFLIYKSREGLIDSNFEAVHFRVKRSDDCGKTWTALGGSSGVSVHGTKTAVTYFTVSFGNPSKGKVACARSSDAWIATSPKPGEVFAAYVDRDDSGFAQIYVAHSIDQGASWLLSRVTDGKNNSAYPEIAVTDSGAVGVMYIDYDDAGPNTIFRHRFAVSMDGAKTWPVSHILQTMDPGKLNNATDGVLWGDYEGLTAFGNTFYGVFTGESINRSVLQLDPIFFKFQSP
jgi:hypothetical protein